MFSIIVEDLRHFRIRNASVLVLIGLFLLGVLLAERWSEMIWHGLFGGLALGVMFAAFALRVVGAGDAKLLAVACLWVGPDLAPTFALALFVLSTLFAAGAFLRIVPVRRVAGKLKMPFGPSIAGAWLLTIVSLPLARLFNL